MTREEFRVLERMVWFHVTCCAGSRTSIDYNAIEGALDLLRRERLAHPDWPVSVVLVPLLDDPELHRRPDWYLEAMRRLDDDERTKKPR